VKSCAARLLLLLLVAGLRHWAPASPAPAPSLQSPAQGATNVDPDTTLTWRWVDDLIANGSFESGMDPGWYTSGANPDMWQIFTSTTNTWGMGYRLAGTQTPYFFYPATGQLIQSIYIPADAVSATLQWSERIFDMVPTYLLARLRVMMYQGGAWVRTLEDALGNEPVFLSHNWVTRSTNLLAYAGQSFDLVIQANTYDPRAVNSWFADVDGFGLACEHASATPQFLVWLGKSAALGETNQIGATTALSLIVPPLQPFTRYYWRVGALRDGVTNFSSTAYFNTGQRVLPALRVVGVTNTGVRLSFPTRAGRNYSLEQRDRLDATAGWYICVWVGQGTNGPMEVEVPLPWADAAFWRLRVDP
jgi:hypothetical protein